MKPLKQLPSFFKKHHLQKHGPVSPKLISMSFSERGSHCRPTRPSTLELIVIPLLQSPEHLDYRCQQLCTAPVVSDSRAGTRALTCSRLRCTHRTGRFIRPRHQSFLNRGTRDQPTHRPSVSADGISILALRITSETQEPDAQDTCGITAALQRQRNGKRCSKKATHPKYRT